MSNAQLVVIEQKTHYTVDELAEALDVHRNTAIRWLEDAGIEGIKANPDASGGASKLMIYPVTPEAISNFHQQQQEKLKRHW